MVGSLRRMGDVLRAARLALALSLSTASSVAWADEGLVVTRSEGAADCPDSADLQRLALAPLAPASPPPAHAYRVSFDRSGSSYRAEIADDTAGRVRRLEDVGPGCGPLGQAAAQVVAMMRSSEREDAAPSPAPVVPPSPAESLPGPEPRRRLRGVLGAGPALAVAIVRPAAPALVVDGVLQLSHASLGLGALWIPSQTIAVAPGSIDVQLIAGSLRGCGFFGDVTQVGLCSKIFVGALRAEGSGYSADARHTRPWFAIEPELYADRALAGWLRCRATAGVVVPLHAETFSVTGAGTAYATPAAGALASIALEIATP